MDHPKFIVSKQKDESISTLRTSVKLRAPCFTNTISSSYIDIGGVEKRVPCLNRVRTGLKSTIISLLQARASFRIITVQGDRVDLY